MDGGVDGGTIEHARLPARMHSSINQVVVEDAEMSRRQEVGFGDGGVPVLDGPCLDMGSQVSTVDFSNGQTRSGTTPAGGVVGWNLDLVPSLEGAPSLQPTQRTFGLKPKTAQDPSWTEMLEGGEVQSV
jgi:hypothetical protein